MLQIDNATPFKAVLMLLPDRRGIDTLYTVIKGTFALGASIGLSEEQVPVTLADEYHGDPAASSIRAPSDVSIGKPATDVLLHGSAWAPGGRATWQSEVALSVGPVSKSVRVFGDRVWQAGATGATAQWVAPFERMPLVWERAYGGSDETEQGAVAESRNPVGRGFRAASGRKVLDGMALPNIEDPATPIASPKDAPEPAGFGAVASHWLQRRRYAGTYDAAWEKNRAPYLPDDFDPRFTQVAAPGLTTPAHLQGGEVVEVRGATPDGQLRFALPAAALQAGYRVEGRVDARPARLDTVLIEPDAGRLVLVWRAELACDKKAMKVREVEVSLLRPLAGAAA